MKILFSMRHSGALRNFASTVRELARRGHQVHLAFMTPDTLSNERLLWELTNDHVGITASELWKGAAAPFWARIARDVRSAGDSLRYRTPAFEHARSLRRRAESRLAPWVMAALRLPLIRTRRGSAWVARMLRACERAMPTDRRVMQVISHQKPDVVLVTPLVDLESDQVEYVKAARALGIPSGLCVHSWDNLTNKGLIHVAPDRVFVWNEAQKREAAELHGVRAASVVVTGAPVFDEWFTRRPSTTREEFCRKVGLPADKPFFLYVCSSKFIAPDEPEFIARWIDAVRSAPDPRVREAGILVRPHPQTRVRLWSEFDKVDRTNVVRWPRVGAKPVDAGTKDDYFDSLYHAAAIVGINTSAQIEAGIVGRPVFSIRAREYAGTQEGTLHFHYLLKESGGLLHLADTFDEHVGALAGVLDAPEERARQLRAFVYGFVRPKGLDVPATPLLADAIEELGRMPAAAPARMPLRLYPVRLALAVVGAIAQLVRGFSEQREQGGVAAVLRKGFIEVPVGYFLRWAPARRFARRYIVPRAAPPAPAGEAPTEEFAAIAKTLSRLSSSSRPVVVGPWLNDVGSELLCWIPFLNWVKTCRRFDPERLVVVSRGGAAAWYRNISDRYFDVADLLPAEQFRARMAERRRNKEDLVWTDFDREVLASVHERLGTSEVELLHPRQMYRLFRPYWRDQMPLDRLETIAAFRRLPQVDAGDLADALPRDYVAVQFAFSDAFPDVEENRRFIRRVVEMLAEATDVVLLEPDASIGPSWQAPIRHRRVHAIGHLMTLRTSLEVQTKVVSRARAFVGAVGGSSYVAPFTGVVSLAFYSHREKFPRREWELAQRAFARCNARSYAFETGDLDVLGLAFRDRDSSMAAAAPPKEAVL